jgi:putative ABC transport system permease protein
MFGTALVFAMTLLVTGMSAGFHAEADHTLAGLGGTGFVVPTGSPGPFGSLIPEPEATAAAVHAIPGVRRASAMVIVPEWVTRNGRFVLVNMIGHQLGALGEPTPDAGRRESGPGEVVVDRASGFRIGEVMGLAGRTFRVVGTTTGRTYTAGVATAYLSVADAQAVAFAGRALISAVLVDGVPATIPAGQLYLTRSQVAATMLRPLVNAEKSIANTRTMLWIVAVAILAGVMYVAALERVRDFAVLKAVGARSRSLVSGLMAEAVILALLAAALSVGLSRLLRPTMKGMPLSLTATAAVASLVVAVVVGVAASLSGVRRALRTDPALAFGGS